MFKLRYLHTWLLGCVIVFAVAGTTNAHTYQSYNLVQTELVFEHLGEEHLYDLALVTSPFHINNKSADLKLLINYYNSLSSCYYEVQNEKLYNSLNNYILQYSQLLARITFIDLAV